MTSKKVSFGDSIIIIEYPIILGDNPGVSSGAPIQIGWEPIGIKSRNLEMFEYTHQNRRRGGELKITVEKRGRLLLRAGYSMEAIGEAALTAGKIRKERVETLQRQGWDRVTLAMLRTGRLPKDVIHGKGVVKTGKEVLTHRSQSFRRELLQSTGRTLKRIVQPVQRSFEARSA
jgi:hypothetical protein